MKTTFIYRRVSDEEQVKGYSLSDQDERLIRWCQRQELQITGSYADEGVSAKNFDRPGYQKMKKDACKLKPDFILFINWKRFARNLEEGLKEIRLFRNSRTTPQAIDEWIDFSQTGYKYMLALYLVSAEVDNDQRSEAVLRGMRRSMKEGNRVNKAPRGYLNANNGKPTFAIDPTKAPLIKEMFDLMATGIYSQQEVRKMMWQKGLKYCRTNFKIALENFTYIGKIKIPAYKGEPEQIVKGTHEPIVDESVFYRVQQIISPRKPKKKPTRLNEDLPLRGFLHCTKDHKMTGSCSHGHGGKYYYYHCPNTNCERHRAILANNAYVSFLQTIKIDPEYSPVVRTFEGVKTLSDLFKKLKSA